MLHLSRCVADSENLITAAASNDSTLVKQLVQQGISVDATNPQGMTPLIAAAKHGHTTIVAWLLAHGADSNRGELRGVTPLMAAAAAGQVAVAKILLDHQANLTAIDSINRTPLLLATHHGHLDTVRLLLDHGAPVDTADYCGWTALYNAAYEGHLDIVALLLARGANVNLATVMHWTPLYGALKRNHTAIMALLLNQGAETQLVIPDREIRIEPSQPIYDLLLLHAAQTGSLTLMKKLLEIDDHGVFRRINTHFGGMAIHAAVASQHQALVELLLAKGASLDQKDYLGQTPIFKTLKAAEFTMFEWLTRSDPNFDPNACDGNQGQSLLHHLARHDNLQGVRHLLALGVDINARDDEQCTALHLALQKNQFEIAAILIQAGADLAAVDKHFNTPLHCIRQKTPEAILTLLLNHGAQVDATNTFGETPLFVAITCANPVAIQLLLAAHASPHHVNLKGQSVLHVAIQCNQRFAIQYLAELESIENLKQLELNILDSWNLSKEWLAVIREIIVLKEQSQAIWHQHVKHPEFYRLLRAANLSLYGTCKNPSEQTQLPKDVLFQIANYQVSRENKAAKNFVSAFARYGSLFTSTTAGVATTQTEAEEALRTASPPSELPQR